MEMLAATSSHEKKEKEEEDEEEAIEQIRPKVSRKATQVSVHEAKKDLMQEEERQTNAIKWSVYKEYWTASGTILNVPILAILVSLAQGMCYDVAEMRQLLTDLFAAAQLLGTLWLSWWSDQRYNLPVGGYVSDHDCNINYID